jgi:hypothetical protein
MTGTVSVGGDHSAAVLIASNGRRFPPGTVPVGSYDLEVTFPDGKTITRHGLVEVREGQVVSLRCSARVENCR